MDSFAFTVASIIELRSGNLFDQDWGGQYDMILLLSVAHNQTLEENRTLFKRVAGALNSGGMFVVHEYLRTEQPTEFQAAFDLTLLVETGTRLLSEETLGLLICEAGLTVDYHVDLAPADKGTDSAQIARARCATMTRPDVLVQDNGFALIMPHAALRDTDDEAEKALFRAERCSRSSLRVGALTRPQGPLW